MTSENDYEIRYAQAETAYSEGDYHKANQITDSMDQDYPNDPSILLLKGHIYFVLQDYALAQNKYNSVIELSDHQELVSAAYQGLEQINQQREDSSGLENFYPSDQYLEDDDDDDFDLEYHDDDNFNDDLMEIDEYDDEYDNDDFDLTSDEVDSDLNNNQVNFDEYGYDEDDEDDEDWTSSIPLNSIETYDLNEDGEEIEEPTLQQTNSFDPDFSSYTESETLTKHKNEIDPLDEFFDSRKTDILSDQPIMTNDFSWEQNNESEEYAVEDINIELNEEEINYHDLDDDSEGEEQDTGTPTFVVSDSEEQEEFTDLEKILTSNNSDDDFNHEFDNFNDDDDEKEGYSSPLQPMTSENQNVLSNTSIDEDDQNEIPILNESKTFKIPDELDDLPEISGDELPVSSIFTKDENDDEISGSFDVDPDFYDDDEDDHTFDPAEPFTDFKDSSNSIITPQPEVEVPLAKFKFLQAFFNASLQTKQLMNAGVTGLITFLLILIIGCFNLEITPKQEQTSNSNPEQTSNSNPEPKPIFYPWAKMLLLSLIGGLASGGTTLGIGYFLLNPYLKRYTNNLQNQFQQIDGGDFNVKATVYSQDEFGQLAAGFNQMAKNINTITNDARKRAEETERAREDLQRQVIHLLDDVEGAARGNLTVQAEVTADVLGAVADAFNLTITNLQEIVVQVKKAALEVNKASTDSEAFARNQSSDALSMAEELAVTLNSVQMMTDAIQRISEYAREAEEVARTSSVTALKGGEAVERTVVGILQIRETVAETARKVKRLAEASQQISTIVAVISQVSSRTNLLALNASIQAAKAGEAGKGFAVVADEVRQLADRSDKSLQEIEQIVLQIQTETGSVMKAMEDGLQQVIDVTERSEQAKGSLEDIIQVSNRIDSLVRSITADTVEQRENSRAVAKVMQAVELTAQATSQESQRVAGSLQNLVFIAKDLLSSVERFKVSKDD